MRLPTDKEVIEQYYKMVRGSDDPARDTLITMKILDMPTDADIVRLHKEVLKGLLGSPTPEALSALKELSYHALLGLAPRRKLASRKKTGKPSQEREILKLAAALLRELIDKGKASAGPEGVVLPRGFASELSRRCDLAGIEMDKRRVEAIVKGKDFKFKLYWLVRPSP